VRLFHYAIRFVRNLFGKQQADRELDEELRSYATMLADEKLAAGMTAQEAHRQACIELGGIEQVKEDVRDVHAGAFLDSRLQDLRYAARILRKSPGFSAVAILTLALGMGATTAIFSVVNAVLLHPLPIRDPNSVVVLHDQLPMFDVARTKVSPFQFREFSQRTELFESTAAWKAANLTLTVKDRAFRLQAIQTTSGLFALLGMDPLMGRAFTQLRRHVRKSTRGHSQRTTLAPSVQQRSQRHRHQASTRRKSIRNRWRGTWQARNSLSSRRYLDARRDIS
jgi:hypothetical protein